jgi:uncharacterized protein (TIGR03032 family)
MPNTGTGETATDTDHDTPQNEPLNVSYSMSNGFVSFLNQQDIALAATSYQSGRLYLLSRNPKGGLMVNEQQFRKAMGLYVDGDTLLLATLANIYRLENMLKPGLWINETYTHCYVPRTGHFTGALDTHDVAITADRQIIFVNTRFNCIAALSDRHSFRPFWKPDFISKIVDEDRCHLNGFALDEGELRFVSAVSKSNTVDGWRDRRDSGGIIIDAQSNEIICDGLSMPHSPRIHQDRLWIANSGTGEIGWIERAENGGSGKFHALAFCPGFVRGLAFVGNFAVVGLSRPRYQRFEGLELEDRLKAADSEPWCGIQVIDISTGVCQNWFRIDGDIGELYDVAVLPHVGCAQSLHSLGDSAINLITQDD